MSTLFSGHYLRNRSTLDIGVLGYIGIVQHKEHSPEVFHIPPETPLYTYLFIYLFNLQYTFKITALGLSKHLGASVVSSLSHSLSLSLSHQVYSTRAAFRYAESAGECHLFTAL